VGSFKYKDKEITFWSFTGEVSAQQKFSSTDKITEHEFWIKREDGIEKSIQLSVHDILLREGQTIILISAKPKGAESCFYSVVVNHNAKKHWYINTADALSKLFKIEVASGKSILISAGLGAWGASDRLSKRRSCYWSHIHRLSDSK